MPKTSNSSKSDAHPFYFYGCTDVGLMRKHNEDAFGFFDIRGQSLEANGSLAADSPLLAVLSDGVGGHDGGDIASAYVVSALASIIANCQPPAAPSAFDDCRKKLHADIVRLNDEILSMAAARNQERGMAATLTAAWFLPKSLIAMHAGDSRLYRLRQGMLKQLTIDDTVAGRGLADGSLTEEQARKHPKRHVLQNAVGIPADEFSVAIEQHSIEPGDIYLICSDGLTDGLTDKDLQKALTFINEGTPPESMLERLVEAANQNSGKDNITIQIVHYPAVATSAPANTSEPITSSINPSTHPTMRTWTISTVIILLILFVSLATVRVNQKNETAALQRQWQTQFDSLNARLNVLAEATRQHEQASLQQLNELNAQLESFHTQLSQIESNHSGVAEQLQSRYQSLKSDFERTFEEARSGLDDALALAMQRLDTELEALRKNADALRSTASERYQRTRRELEQVQKQLADWWQQATASSSQSEEAVPQSNGIQDNNAPSN